MKASELSVDPHVRWTGHPLVDMGLATIAAFSGVADPADLTTEHFESFAQYLESALATESIRSHASVLFTINAPYLQRSFAMERRTENARRILRSYEQATNNARNSCVYCRRPAIRLETVSGKAYREFIPMVTGHNVVNFAPYGQHGFAICGFCVPALQALIIGAPSCESRALIVDADDPSQLVELIGSAEWLGTIRARIDLSRATGKKVDTWKSPRSRLIDALVALERRGEESATAGFTIYHATNSKEPGIDIYPLAATIAGFVRRAQGAAFAPARNEIRRRQWRDDKRRAVDRDPGPEERPYWRNRLYEDLFALPVEAPTFIRRYILIPERSLTRTQAASDHVPKWPLTQLFLEEVLGVDQDRIDQIRVLGDALADEIVTNTDRPLARRAFRVTRYDAVRRLIIAANNRRIQRGAAPLLSFDGFLSVFEVGEEIARADWRLAWDLVLIRLTDQLFDRQWFSAHPETTEDLVPESDDEAGEELETLPTAAD